MLIEDADYKLTAFVRKALANEMATVLRAEKVDVEDDQIVANTLSRRFSSISIANLMTDAQDVIRCNARRSFVAALIAAAGAVSVASYGSLIAGSDMGQVVERVMRAPAKSVACALKPRVVVIDRSSVSTLTGRV